MVIVLEQNQLVMGNDIFSFTQKIELWISKSLETLSLDIISKSLGMFLHYFYCGSSL